MVNSDDEQSQPLSSTIPLARQRSSRVVPVHKPDNPNPYTPPVNQRHCPERSTPRHRVHHRRYRYRLAYSLLILYEERKRLLNVCLTASCTTQLRHRRRSYNRAPSPYRHNSPGRITGISRSAVPTTRVTVPGLATLHHHRLTHTERIGLPKDSG